MEKKALYAAFDLFPSSKGASTHIAHMSSFLFDKYNGGQLYVLGNHVYEAYEKEGNVEVFRYNEQIPNFLMRAQKYSAELAKFVQNNATPDLVHFRDIWGGLGLLSKKRSYKAVFEVNAFPSVELPYRYNNLSKSTLKKLENIENFCLNNSDVIITPSNVIKENILKRGFDEQKVKVVTNAGDLNPQTQELTDLPKNYILYFGALQIWQGVDDLLKAMALLKDLDLHLVICSANRPKQVKNFKKLVAKLGIEDKVEWKFQLEKPVLNTVIKNALLSIAPLKECSRNLDQGCSPLKIFESFACNTTVIASDLPVTREIITHKESGYLVRPERPQELSRTIRLLYEYPEMNQRLAKNGRALIEEKYNWGLIRQQMEDIYDSLL